MFLLNGCCDARIWIQENFLVRKHLTRRRADRYLPVTDFTPITFTPMTCVGGDRSARFRENLESKMATSRISFLKAMNTITTRPFITLKLATFAALILF